MIDVDSFLLAVNVNIQLERSCDPVIAEFTDLLSSQPSTMYHVGLIFAANKSVFTLINTQIKSVSCADHVWYLRLVREMSPSIASLALRLIHQPDVLRCVQSLKHLMASSSLIELL